jgi:hypothetical protein
MIPALTFFYHAAITLGTLKYAAAYGLIKG